MKVTAAVCCVWHICFNAGLNVSAWFGKWLISPLPHLWKAADAAENMAAYCRRECAAVNMLGSKHSCGRLLIGELASWGSKHMRQLRSDSCCAAGGADEQGLSGVPPLFITADKRSEVLPKTKATAPVPTRRNYWEELSSPLKVSGVRCETVLFPPVFCPTI